MCRSSSVWQSDGKILVLESQKSNEIKELKGNGKIFPFPHKGIYMCRESQLESRVTAAMNLDGVIRLSKLVALPFYLQGRSSSRLKERNNTLTVSIPIHFCSARSERCFSRLIDGWIGCRLRRISQREHINTRSALLDYTRTDRVVSTRLLTLRLAPDTRPPSSFSILFCFFLAMQPPSIITRAPQHGF